MWKKFIEALKKWFEKQKPIVAPPVEDKPVDPPKSADSPVDPVQPAGDSDEAKHGFSHPATITHRIAYIRHNEGNIYFTNPRLNWLGGELVGEAQMSIQHDDGTWTKPKKFDHVRATTTSRDFKNIHDGYQDWVEPDAGTLCAFLEMSYDKVKRTNAIFFNWK